MEQGPETNLEKYPEPSPLCDLDNPELKELAAKIAGDVDAPIEAALRMFSTFGTK